MQWQVWLVAFYLTVRQSIISFIYHHSNSLRDVQKHLDGVWGLHWWQFLFLIEGSATIVCI